MNKYFRCYSCAYIYYKDTGEFVKDKEVQNIRYDFDKIEKMEHRYCKKCSDYKRWEMDEYDFN